MMYYIYDILYRLFYNYAELKQYQLLTLEFWSAFVTMIVFCLPFYLVWCIIKRFL